ncbi:MAG: ABC transporter substrate-binding protein [Bdellovibrionota bacterium]
MRKILKITLLSALLPLLAFAETSSVKVGIGAILSGDLAVFGQSDLQAAKLYLKNYSRHDIKLIEEDARLSSSDGLRAYQKLINLDHVDVLIAAGTSNGIMAAKGLVNSSQTVTLMASTGGYNIDKAGPWLFRIGNSDTLNGIQQAKLFIDKGIKNVALLTELTEYTTDISKAFKDEFLSLGGKLSYDDSFLPNTTDFRSQATAIIKTKPEAIFMPTQTGTALGIFVKQLRLQEGNTKLDVHTTMVAAPNPDAHKIAGKHIIGVYYMDPSYGKDGAKYKEFIKLYKHEYGEEPATAFHVASVLDCLEHLQNFLDLNKNFSNTKFKDYLENKVGNYCGYMGCYTFDSDGNTSLGFVSSRILELIS